MSLVPTFRVRGVIALSALGLLAGAIGARAEIRTWMATGTNDWWTGGNWSGSAVPVAGDEVYITNANVKVLLTNSAPASGWLSSLTISNTATLLFTNWDTKLSATNVIIRTNAVLTCAGPFTNAPAMSNRVYVVCSNLVIDTGGKINVDYVGYAGGVNSVGNGPGAGTRSASGAGYGGRGGGYNNIGGSTYGSYSAPVDPGSGGMGSGWGAMMGAPGGGAVRIDAAGQVLVNGTITANGNYAIQGSGSGSGGGIYITCNTFGGTNGLVQARGGEYAASAYLDHGVGCGGGGRIAVVYVPASQVGLPRSSVTFSALPGLKRGPTWPPADIGTLYFSDLQLLDPDNMPHSGQLMFESTTTWAPNRLVVTNGWIRFVPDDFVLTVTNDFLVIGPTGRFDVGGSAVMITNGSRVYSFYSTTNPVVDVRGNLIVTNSGSLHVFAAATNSAVLNYGALLSVTGDVMIATNSWVYLYSHATNGGSPLLRMQNLTIYSGGGISADGNGYIGGLKYDDSAQGPGRGYLSQGGGGYGGVGGKASGTRGQTYGSFAAPLDPGSGGSCGYASGAGGMGGGLIRIEAAGDVTVNGVLSANGGSYSSFGGGGAGGGIYVTCRTIAGNGGVVNADGGAGVFYSGIDGGGGGGGRIAVIYDTGLQTLIPDIRFSASSQAGSAGYGEAGTVYFLNNLFLTETIRNSGQWMVPNFTNWMPNRLTISNAWFRLPADRFRLTVTNALTLLGTNDGFCRLELSNGVVTCGSDLTLASSRLTLFSGGTTGSTLTCGGNLILTNAISGTNPSSFYVYGAMTNSGTPDYGALVAVGGNMYVGSNCWVYPVSHPTNGGSPLFRMRNLTLATTNSGFNASGMGFAGSDNNYVDNAMGPGRGLLAQGGGGYGGRGGKANATRGITYGSSNAPVDPGSGGSCGYASGGGGRGGGVVRIQAPEGVVTLTGKILADGNNSGSFSGGGSGGSIYLVCRKFVGLSGGLSANGGTGYVDLPNTNLWGGGGGGGRIAVWRVKGDAGACSITATGAYGGAATGEEGTIVWNWIPEAGTVFVVH